MPRPAEFTDQIIRTKIEEMAARGERLTAFAVRRALGGGNMSRIAAILKEWEERSVPPAAETETVELPAELQIEVDARMMELAASLSRTIARIHRQATQVAELRVAEAFKTARATATATEAELVDARVVMADSDIEVEKLQLELDQARQAETKMREESVGAKEKLAAMTERAEAAERHIVDLTTRLDALAREADEARERAAASEAKAREADAERQRALARELALSGQMESLHSLLGTKFDQSKA